MKLSFVVQLLVTSLIALAVAFLFQQFILAENHFPLLLIEIVVFILSAFLVHQLALAGARSQNKYAFSRITMGNTFIKLFLVVGMVAIYKTVMKPESVNFVWPFILIYVIFTVFETKFLLKLAKL